MKRIQLAIHLLFQICPKLLILAVLPLESLGFTWGSLETPTVTTNGFFPGTTDNSLRDQKIIFQDNISKHFRIYDNKDRTNNEGFTGAIFHYAGNTWLRGIGLFNSTKCIHSSTPDTRLIIRELAVGSSEVKHFPLTEDNVEDLSRVTGTSLIVLVHYMSQLWRVYDSNAAHLTAHSLGGGVSDANTCSDLKVINGTNYIVYGDFESNSKHYVYDRTVNNGAAIKTVNQANGMNDLDVKATGDFYVTTDTTA